MTASNQHHIIWLSKPHSLGPEIRDLLANRYALQEVSSPAECLSVLRKEPVSVAFVEVDLLGEQAMETIRELKRLHERVCVVAVTRKKSIEEAVQVMHQGAFDYIHEKEEVLRIPSIIERAIESQEREAEINDLRAELSAYVETDQVCIGKSGEIRRVMQVVERIAPLPTTVLLQGESGTGKEVMARLIHRKSHLSTKPFVTVSLPSIPGNLVESVLFGHEKGSFTSAHRRHYGKFELADGGTIFLDEIGDLPLDIQSKLLRVIQEGEIERVGGTHPIPINVRVIAASKLDLHLAVKAGRFRDDLFYRLNVVPIILPPLRRRLQDLAEFSELFIERYAKKFNKKAVTISSGAIETLGKYQWPGNIRELENLIERIIAIMDPTQEAIGKEDIPLEYYFGSFTERSPSGMGLDDAMVQYEKNLIMKALRKNNWNRKKTAQSLGISYGILKYKVRKLNIKVPASS